jgi:hypothetical protein
MSAAKLPKLYRVNADRVNANRVHADGVNANRVHADRSIVNQAAARFLLLGVLKHPNT